MGRYEPTATHFRNPSPNWALRIVVLLALVVFVPSVIGFIWTVFIH